MSARLETTRSAAWFHRAPAAFPIDRCDSAPAHFALPSGTDVPCVFQIWELKEIERDTEIKYIPNKFIFTKDKDIASFSFRRVGVNSGKVDLNTDKSEQSHYFIKLDKNINNKPIIKTLSKYEWDFNDTIGAKSISKNQIIKVLNEIILKEEKN